ncbi:unnamed protein product [Urochloa humidicola]
MQSEADCRRPAASHLCQRRRSCISPPQHRRSTTSRCRSSPYRLSSPGCSRSCRSAATEAPCRRLLLLLLPIPLFGFSTNRRWREEGGDSPEPAHEGLGQLRDVTLDAGARGIRLLVGLPGVSAGGSDACGGLWSPEADSEEIGETRPPAQEPQPLRRVLTNWT